MSKRVFVSYTTRDQIVNIPLLENIKSTLSPLGSTFVDLLDNNSTNHQDRIIHEIRKADLLLLVGTPKIFESPWVLFEMHEALNNRIPIFLTNFEIFYNVKNPFNILSNLKRAGNHNTLYATLNNYTIHLCCYMHL